MKRLLPVVMGFALLLLNSTEGWSLKNLFNAIIGSLGRSRVVQAIVRAQHRICPVPIGLYEKLFFNRIVAVFFSWYGNQLFHVVYENCIRNMDFWTSKESLYWFLGNARHQVKTKAVNWLFSIAEARAILLDDSITVLDLGCGVMKEEAHMIANHGFSPKQIVGIDANPWVSNVVTMPSFSKVAIGDVTEMDLAAYNADAVFVFGGVFEYLSSEDVRRVLHSLQSSKLIVIFGDVCGSEHTTLDHRKAAFLHNHNYLEMLTSFNVIRSEHGIVAVRSRDI